MALQVGNFCGFETGDGTELSAVIGSGSYSTTTVKTGTYSRAQNTAPSATYVELDNVVDNLTDQGDKHICGVDVRFSATSTGPILFLHGRDDGPFTTIYVSLNSSQELELRDASQSVLDTSTETLSTDTWYHIDLVWEHLASGDAEVFLNGTSVLSATAQDFTNGNNFVGYRFSGAPSAGGSLTTYFDNCYTMSGATSASDRLGPVECYGWETSVTGTAPTVGDTLDAGDWGNIGSTSGTGSDAEYTAAALTEGAVDFDGPSSAAETFGGTIKASKFFFNVDRDGGGGSTHHVLLGNSSQAIGALPSFDDGVDWPEITTTPTDYFIVSEASLPTAAQDIRAGFGLNSGGQDIHMYESMVFLLHIPVSGSTTPQTVAAVASNVAVMLEVPVFVQAVDALVAAVANFSLLNTFKRTLAVVTNNVAVLALLSTFFRTIAVVTNNTASVIKQMFVTFTAVVAAVASLIPASLVSQAIAAVVSATAAVSTTLTRIQIMAANASNIASIAKIATFFRTLTTSTSNVAAMVRQISKSITSVVSALAAITTANFFTQAISAVSNNPAVLASAAVFGKTIAAVSANIATLTKASINFVSIAASVAATATVTVVTFAEKFFKAQSARASFIREKRHVKRHGRRRRKH